MVALRSGHRRTPAAALVLALATLVAAPSARANVPGADTLSLPIRVPQSWGGYSVGKGTLDVTYTDAKATATVRAPAVTLGTGQVFRVNTCVKYDVAGGKHDATCGQRVVDTRDNTATVTVAATAAPLTVNRPAAGSRAAISYVVGIDIRQPNGSYKQSATSWPAGGLAPAAVAVPPVGATTGTLPPTQGVALPGSRTATGGVNSGYPDSFCAPNTSDMTAPPREGVTQDALGTDAPAYDEVGEPTGDYAGLQPKGVMMIVHGGGWFVVGSGQVQVTRDEADRWRARGWRTVSVTYHACADAVKDVLWFHDRVRALYGDAIPLCMTGGSAGGHLALVTAYARPDVACVIDRGGPVDAATLKDERAWSDTDAAGQLDGPRWAYNLMTAAWGQDNLPWYSPALFKIPARVLVGVAAHDPYVPYDQALELADKLHARNPAAYVDTVRLANGTVPWVHASVDQAAVDDFDRREQDLVAPLIAQG